MPSSAILVPLYIYPLLGAWNPLYEVIEANPTTQFQVVINPHNGPGTPPLPDSNYCREIPKLRSHPNVVVYGYVNVVWATRDLDEVCKDVEIYAAWPQHWHHHHQMNLQTQHDTKQAPQHQDQNVSVPIGIDGVFVDETPIDAGDHEKNFLGSLKTLVESHFSAKKKAATPGQKYPLVSYNFLFGFEFWVLFVSHVYGIELYCPWSLHECPGSDVHCLGLQQRIFIATQRIEIPTGNISVSLRLVHSTITECISPPCG
jgi:hypothetical protein